MSMRRTVVRHDDSRDLMDDVREYESSRGLTAAQKIALRLHDVFLSNPRGVDAALRAEALAHFSAPQLVELTLKFFHWSTNRPVVVLRSDAPHDPDRLTPFHYDEQGNYIVHST
jgi:hypothetical protein